MRRLTANRWGRRPGTRTRSVASRELLSRAISAERMMIWLREMSGQVDLHGTDVDAEAIAWV